jgi:putative flippase GtrA
MPSLLRYLLGQVLAYFVDFGLFYLFFIVWNVYPPAANAIGKVAAASFAFLFHRQFTFQAHRESVAAQAVKYVSLLILNTVLSSVLLSFALDLSAPVVEAKLVVDLGLILMNYGLTKVFVFSTRGP